MQMCPGACALHTQGCLVLFIGYSHIPTGQLPDKVTSYPVSLQGTLSQNPHDHNLYSSLPLLASVLNKLLY